MEGNILGGGDWRVFEIFVALEGGAAFFFWFLVFGIVVLRVLVTKGVGFEALLVR